MSRRLSRRLNKELHHGNYGYVKLCVRAYVRLLEDSRPELSNLFATEIVVKSAVRGRTLPSSALGPAAPCKSTHKPLFERHTAEMQHQGEERHIAAHQPVSHVQAKRKRDWMCRKTTPAHAGEGSMGSVVGVLLLHPDVEIRMLGVELLTEFTRLQVGGQQGASFRLLLGQVPVHSGLQSQGADSATLRDA